MLLVQRPVSEGKGRQKFYMYGRHVFYCIDVRLQLGSGILSCKYIVISSY